MTEKAPRPRGPSILAQITEAPTFIAMVAMLVRTVFLRLSPGWRDGLPAGLIRWKYCPPPGQMSAVWRLRGPRLRRWRRPRNRHNTGTWDRWRSPHACGPIQDREPTGPARERP